METISDARAGDREHDRQEALIRSLQLLRAGLLIVAPGVVLERIGDSTGGSAN